MTPDELVFCFESLGRGEVGPLADRLAEDVVLRFPGRRFGGTFTGRRRVEVFLRQNQRLFRDGPQFEVSWSGVLGDRAVVQWCNAGTTRSGVSYRNRGITLLRLDGSGRIREIDDYLDTERIAETWP